MPFGLGTIKLSRQLEFLVAPRRPHTNAAASQRFPQQGFDLGVHAAKFCGGQTLDGGQYLGAHAHQKCASSTLPVLVHIARHDLAVQRAGIDHGLGLTIGAQHH